MLGCYEMLREMHPNARGRIITRWEMKAKGGQARCTRAEITANVGLREPSFVDCVTAEIGKISLAVEAKNTIEIEYPFFLPPEEEP